MDFLLPFRKIMLIWNTVAEDLFLHLETNGRLEWIFLTGSEEMIVHTETKVMFCWCLIDSHDKTIAESTSVFSWLFSGFDEKTLDAQIVLYLWCYIMETILRLYWRRRWWCQGVRIGGRGVQNPNFSLSLFLFLYPRYFLRFWGLLQNHNLHFCIHVFSA